VLADGAVAAQGTLEQLLASLAETRRLRQGNQDVRADQGNERLELAVGSQSAVV
jgi:hypothetical protein